MQSFAALIAISKGQPGAGTVHFRTALGNERARRRTRIGGIIAPDPAAVTVKRAPARDWTLPMEVRKLDPEQQLIFGWASVVEKDGVAVIDKQGDIIPVPALEEAAYEFVLYSRQQGDMHVEKGVGRLVESMVFTKEKQQALGIDLGMVGWWTGFHVDSPELWAAHKRGERPEFSIGGAAVSVPA